MRRRSPKMRWPEFRGCEYLQTDGVVPQTRCRRRLITQHHRPLIPVTRLVLNTGRLTSAKPPWSTVSSGHDTDEAMRVGISLADWHRRDHGLRCVCPEGEQIGPRSFVVVDALAVAGVSSDGMFGARPGAVGPTR
jgi:hypothetical protein